MSEIKSPKHYKLQGLDIEAIDVIRSVLGEQGFKDYCHGNILKYLIRAGKKYGESDLKDYRKAMMYLDWLIGDKLMQEEKVIIKYVDKYKYNLKPKCCGDAGIDICASEDVRIRWGSNVLIPTNLYVEIPHGYYGRLVGRSSLHAKGLHVNEGIIDSGYRGEIKVSMNVSSADKVEGRISCGDDECWVVKSSEYNIKKGDRIAQLIISKVEPVEFVKVEKLNETERGNNGFGSTGK